GQLEDARVHDREQRLARVDRLALARVPLADLARERRGHRRAARLLARADRLRARGLELRLRRLVRGLRLPELDLRHRARLVQRARGLELARREREVRLGRRDARLRARRLPADALRFDASEDLALADRVTAID